MSKVFQYFFLIRPVFPLIRLFFCVFFSFLLVLTPSPPSVRHAASLNTKNVAAVAFFTPFLRFALRALDIIAVFCYNRRMINVFYGKKTITSPQLVTRVLKKYYFLNDVHFYRTESGKPTCDAPVRFSLTHTGDLFFLAVSDEGEVGIDAEYINRRGNHGAILSRLSAKEKAFASQSDKNFLRLWTRRECICKYLSVPVFTSFSALIVYPKPTFHRQDLAANLATFTLNDCFLSLCFPIGERIGDFIALPPFAE